MATVTGRLPDEMGDDGLSVRDLLRLPAGPVDLAAYDEHGKPGFAGGKSDGKKALAGLADEVADLQERLFADGLTGGTRRMLLVLQGMDTSGKGGTVRHSIGLLDPQGVQLASFQAPTTQELRHDFLWRIRRQLPGPGKIGIFDRSHYEDVLIARVRALAPAEEIERRYAAINDFEAELAASGVTVVKCFLHVSYAEQKQRLLARLDDPHKHWKFDPGDVDERQRWPQYRAAYELALERCNPPQAPWYVVPADRKWYRNWAVTRLLLEHLREFDLGWPQADFDVQQQRERLLAT